MKYRIRIEKKLTENNKRYYPEKAENTIYNGLELFDDNLNWVSILPTPEKKWFELKSDAENCLNLLIDSETDRTIETIEYKPKNK